MSGGLAARMDELVRACGFGGPGETLPVIDQALAARAAGEGLAPLLGARVDEGLAAVAPPAGGVH